MAFSAFHRSENFRFTRVVRVWVWGAIHAQRVVESTGRVGHLHDSERSAGQTVATPPKSNTHTQHTQEGRRELRGIVVGRAG